MTAEPLVEARALTCAKQGREIVKAVSFSLERGRTLAIIGESGAGKSTLVKLIAGLERPQAGSVLVGGEPPRIRVGRVSPVQIVFQNPVEALNRFITVAANVGEGLRGLSKAEREARVTALLEQVGIDPARGDQRLSAFSGGQLQRIVIARALAPRPQLLLCDEPTSALDVSVQAQIVNLLLRLQREEGFASILVTHDLGIAKVLADDILVLRHGAVVEVTPAERFFEKPVESYSRGLLDATAQQSIAYLDGSRAGGLDAAPA